VILRTLVFVSAFVLLQLSWQGLRGTAVERVLVQEVTVHAHGGGLRIENGCEGMEVWFLLFAAFLVAPLTWRSRGLGFLLGTAVVFIVNQLRIWLCSTPIVTTTLCLTCCMQR
jgi:hypothetical protein